MPKYCIVKNGAVTWGPGPLPDRLILEDGTTRTSLDELSGAELLALDLWPVDEVIPEYDPQTQRLAAEPELTVDAENSQVLCEYTVENIADPSIEEQRRIARKQEGFDLYATLAQALDVPAKASDVDIARRVRQAKIDGQEFSIELDGETVTLTPDELHNQLKDTRKQFLDSGGAISNLEDPATLGIDLTFQFEFRQTYCIVRLLRAQWHTTGYDLPPTAAFCALMCTQTPGDGAQDQYPFSYVGDWCVIDDTSAKIVMLYYFQLYWTYYGISSPPGGTAASSSGYKYPITEAQDFSSMFPASGVRKVTRIVSYTESCMTPANLPLHALPSDELVTSILAVDAAWPDFADVSKWMFMGYWASSIEDYHLYYADGFGHSGKHYQFGSQHSYQPSSEAAPGCDYADMYSGSDFRGHKIALSIMAGNTQAHADLYLTGGRNSTALATIQRDVAFPGFTVAGEAFTCA